MTDTKDTKKKAKPTPKPIIERKAPELKPKVKATPCVEAFDENGKRTVRVVVSG